MATLEQIIDEARSLSASAARCWSTREAVAPTLDRKQIADLNKYADTLPFFSTDRKEFKEAARTAEESLPRSEVSEAARKGTEQLRSPDFSARTMGQSPSHNASSTDRSDRDTYSRGR